MARVSTWWAAFCAHAHAQGLNRNPRTWTLRLQIDRAHLKGGAEAAAAVAAAVEQQALHADVEKDVEAMLLGGSLSGGRRGGRPRCCAMWIPQGVLAPCAK